MRSAALILVVLALGAGTARAAPPDRARAAAALASAVRLPSESAPSEAAARADGELRLAGVARTSVERRFSRRAAAEFGFLCGRPDSVAGAGAAVLGRDPHGRFLGAKLSLAFR